MTEYILKIEDQTVLDKIKEFISSVPGVSISPRRKKRKTELDEALEDVAAGRVTRYRSVDDFFKDMGCHVLKSLY